MRRPQVQPHPTGPHRVPSPASDLRPFPSLSVQCWKTFFSLWHQIFTAADNRKDLTEARFPGLVPASPCPHPAEHLLEILFPLLSDLPPASKAEAGAVGGEIHMFPCGKRKGDAYGKSRDQKAVPITQRVPAGVCCLGDHGCHVLSPHPRITHPQGPRGSAKRSTARRVGKLCHAPINDASFMKEEQANGNLCCIESAREEAGQAPLDSWGLGPCPTQPRRRGSERRHNPDCQRLASPHALLFQAPCPSLCHSSLPHSLQMTQLIKPTRWA